MPWSIFSDGGGAGAAATWAIDLLKKIGAPLTAGNEQFIFDWETSEGGGGKYNPLNQGTDTLNPALTSTGNQYGGGAADYVSWSAGLQGAADYLTFPNFSAIADDLKANNPTQARADLINSPWAASHYGGGSGFSQSPFPGKASALPGDSGSSSSSSSPSGITGALTTFVKDIEGGFVLVPLVLVGGGLIVMGAIRMTGAKQKAQAAAGGAAQTAAIGALAA
jgi:hypothetical protein